MDRMFSVDDDIAGHFWSPAAGGDEDESSSSSSASKSQQQKSTMMNRSMSEWQFQRFLQETSSSVPESSSSKVDNKKDDVVVVEVKDPHENNINKSTFVGPPNVPVDSEEYQAYLKSRLNLACAAVALTRVNEARNAKDTLGIVF
ncbi:hypothetical protein Tco_1216364 [Tanacetum coccineum]